MVLITLILTLITWDNNAESGLSYVIHNEATILFKLLYTPRTSIGHERAHPQIHAQKHKRQ